MNRRNGQIIVAELNADVVLVKSGQFGFQDIGIAVITDIRPEGAERLAPEELALHVMHHLEGIIAGYSIVLAIRCQV